MLPFGFSEADAKKIADATAIVLKNYRFGPAERPRFPVTPQGAICKHAIVTTACSGATAGGTGVPDVPSGDGRATLYYFDGTTYQTYATNVQFFNDAPGTSGNIPVNTKIKVHVQDGFWFVYWYLCP
jgi:hypothetical protein